MTRQFSAGGAVYKKDSGEIYWLITKPKPSPQFPKDRYQMPKGLINPGENPEETAIREVREETGITAKVIQKVDTSKYVLNVGVEQFFKIVTWFLMEYRSGEPTADNSETEEVLWLPFEEAKKILTYSSEKTIMVKAASLIN